MAGAPTGNQNAAKGKAWREAIRRAVARKFGGTVDHGLDQLADEFVNAVAGGDLAAFKEFGDRIDGKPAQALIGGEEDDPAIRVEGIAIRLVKPDGA